MKKLQAAAMFVENTVYQLIEGETFMPPSLCCTLCSSPANYYSCFRDIAYYKCTYCQSFMMDPECYLSPEKEKHRYDQHNNDVNDPGYRNFAKPLVEAVIHSYSPEASGLDYGAGPGPVAAIMLREKGYTAQLFDPYYHPDPSVLSNKYDYIMCCEVIEHFKNPNGEFAKLRSMLRDNGSIFCVTEIVDDDIDFMNWYYKNDPTHLFFYHEHALAWIKKHFKFSGLKREGRLIHFEV